MKRNKFSKMEKLLDITASIGAIGTSTIMFLMVEPRYVLPSAGATALAYIGLSLNSKQNYQEHNIK